MNGISKEKQTEKAFQSELSKPDRKHHPDREVLTLLGCQILLQTGEKTIYKLMSDGLPHVKVGNSYRFVRRLVIEWLEDESNRPKHDL